MSFKNVLFKLEALYFKLKMDVRGIVCFGMFLLLDNHGSSFLFRA